MLQQSAYPSCGAPVVFDRTQPQVMCAYCRSPLVPLQRGDAVTLEAFDKVKEALDQSSRATQAAIFEAERQTQQELQQMRFSQELSSLRTQLSQVQFEQRALARVRKKDRTVRRQIQDLCDLEIHLIDQITDIERELGVTGPTLHRVPGDISSCGRIMLGAIIWVGTFAVLSAVFPENLIGAALIISIIATPLLLDKFLK